MTATMAGDAPTTTPPSTSKGAATLVAEAAGRLRSPLAEVVAECHVLNDAAALLADRLADDPATLLMLIKAHLARGQKTIT